MFESLFNFFKKKDVNNSSMNPSNTSMPVQFNPSNTSMPMQMNPSNTSMPIQLNPSNTSLLDFKLSRKKNLGYP